MTEVEAVQSVVTLAAIQMVMSVVIMMRKVDGGPHQAQTWLAQETYGDKYMADQH